MLVNSNWYGLSNPGLRQEAGETNNENLQPIAFVVTLQLSKAPSVMCSTIE